MYCSKCGQKVPEDARFCDRCGSIVSETIGNGECNNSTEIEHKSVQQRKYVLSICISVCISVVLLLGIVIFYYMNNDSSSDNKSSKDVNIEYELNTEFAENNDEQDDGKSDLEENDFISSEQTITDDKEYVIYENKVYGYQCKYPSLFVKMYESESGLYCKSEDGRALLKVDSSDWVYSVQETLNNYISLYYGTEMDYKSVGETYFAVRLKSQKENMYYYRYSKFDGDFVYSFALDFPMDEFQMYDEIINIIYADFSKQF